MVFAMVRSTTLSRYYVALGAVVVAFLVYCYIFLPLSNGLLYGDFSVFFAAAQRLTQNLPLYEVGPMAYFNPPYFALALTPLTALPFEVVRRLWTVVAYLCTAGACYLLLDSGRATPARRFWLWATLLSLPVFLANMHLGQNSFLVLLGYAAWYAARQRNREALAGMLLCPALVKPQLVIVPVLLMLFTRRWRELMGFAGTSIALAALSVIVVGLDGVKGYLAVARDVADWVNLEHWYRTDMHTPNSLIHEFLAGYWADGLVMLVGAAVITAVYWRTRRGEMTLGHEASLAVMGGLLLAPYAHTHDLIVLAVPWLLLGPTAHGLRLAVLALLYVAILPAMIVGAVGGSGQVITVSLHAVLFALLVAGDRRERGLAQQTSRE